MGLIANSYGKGRVRIMRVHRTADVNEVRELSLLVMLNGGFDRAYTHADNRAVIATDTIKNIVNIVARENIAASAEAFCEALAVRFLERYTQVDSVAVTAHETKWCRLEVAGMPHPHGFVLDANGKPTVHLHRTRDSSTLRSGIENFTFMKSTGSGWTDYVMDEYTTLPETTDRIAATSMDASWSWARLPADTTTTNSTILRTMLELFADTYSHSVQDSLYRMAHAALRAVPDITSITLACPNKHYIPIDLRKFGLAADNLVFTPTDEPHGQIECTVDRT
jgi:urate oxidase